MGKKLSSAGMPPASDQRFCVCCGCTDFAPCATADGPCAWQVIQGDRGICTACSDHYTAPTATLDAVIRALKPTRVRARASRSIA